LKKIDKDTKGSLSDVDAKVGSNSEIDEDLKLLSKDVKSLSESDTIKNTGSLKTLNEFTESMIKQLEVDSIRMQKKSAKEREVMMKEFERVRQQAINELAKSQKMLNMLESIRTGEKSDKSKKDIENQIRQVRTLVENLEGQIKTIDDKRKSVEKLEKETNKRLNDINKKLISTKTAHRAAKSIEGDEKSTEEYFSKVLNDIFDEDAEKLEKTHEKLVATSEGTESSDNAVNSKDEDAFEFEDVFGSNEDRILSKENNVKIKLKDLKGSGTEDKDKYIFSSIMDSNEDKKGNPIDESNDLNERKKLMEDDKDRSKLVKTMVNNLREEIGRLKNDIQNNKFVKGDKKNSLASTKDGDTLLGDEDSTDTKKKAGFGSLVNILKEEIGKVSDKIKKEKEKLNLDEKNADETKMIEEGEKEAKSKIEVRVRSIDDKSLEKELGKTLDDSDEEVKEVTKKMENTVRKQLKDAGLDFGDKLKIKIITTKDKFDKFSDGKDVKLLNDDDATDFKDLLLGFLGGGKEKVNEEQRQRTLEENYNFSLIDDEEEGENLL